MHPILADTATANGSSMWLVVVALGTLSSLAVSVLTLARLASGKGGERQIEPTQIAAIRLELSQQTQTLGDINREVGETKKTLEGVDKKLADQKGEIDKAFHRINSISQESASLKGRFEDHLENHREDRRRA